MYQYLSIIVVAKHPLWLAQDIFCRSRFSAHRLTGKQRRLLRQKTPRNDIFGQTLFMKFHIKRKIDKPPHQRYGKNNYRRQMESVNQHHCLGIQFLGFPMTQEKISDDCARNQNWSGQHNIWPQIIDLIKTQKCTRGGNKATGWYGQDD